MNHLLWPQIFTLFAKIKSA